MIQIARALVDQRKGIAALAGITFSFDPQIATLDTFPRCLITVRTPGQAFRGFAVVPFFATERITMNPEDQASDDLEAKVDLVTRAILAAPISYTRACRIHSQDKGPEVLGMSGSSREALITWAGYASWDTRPSFVLSATSLSVLAAGVIGSTVTVTTEADAAWTAVSNDAWITITAGATGTGTGTVTYTVAANVGTSRTGTMTLANQTFTVSQAAP